MREIFVVAALCGGLLAPAPLHAQTFIPAPSGWTTQTKANGVQTFVPPGLKTGEKYSITVYESAPLQGKTPEAYLRAFAGPVGKTVGQLALPLTMQTDEETGVVTGLGVYNGPNQTKPAANFLGVTMDGGDHIYIMRTLFSHVSSMERYAVLLKRYKPQENALMRQMILRAHTQAGGDAPAKSDKEKRYQWTVAPGKGVSNAQIEAIRVRSDYDVTEGVSTTLFLLLRDGTVYADLPVPPDELDTARSKQHEPEKWGRWRKTALGTSVSLGGAPFEPIPPEEGTPAPAKLRLTGRYSTGRGSNMGGEFSSYSLWGVTFDQAGRFVKDGRGGASVSSGFGEGTSRADTTFGNQGSSTTASGPGYVAGGAQSRNPNGDHEGTYSLSGYVLTLRYDNGRVARLPFFFIDRDVIWFEGALLSLKMGQ